MTEAEKMLETYGFKFVEKTESNFAEIYCYKSVDSFIRIRFIKFYYSPQWAATVDYYDKSVNEQPIPHVFNAAIGRVIVERLDELNNDEVE